MLGPDEMLTCIYMHDSSANTSEITNGNSLSNENQLQDAGDDHCYSRLQFDMKKPEQKVLSLEHPHLYETMKSRSASILTPKKQSRHVYVEVDPEIEVHQGSDDGNLSVPIPKVLCGIEPRPSSPHHGLEPRLSPSHPGLELRPSLPNPGLEPRPSVPHPGVESRPSLPHPALESRPSLANPGLEPMPHSGLESRPSFPSPGLGSRTSLPHPGLESRPSSPNSGLESGPSLPNSELESRQSLPYPGLESRPILPNSGLQPRPCLFQQREPMAANDLLLESFPMQENLNLQPSSGAEFGPGMLMPKQSPNEQRPTLPLSPHLEKGIKGRDGPKPVVMSHRCDSMEGRPLPPLPTHVERMSPSMQLPPSLPQTCYSPSLSPLPPSFPLWPHEMKRESQQPSPLCLEQRQNGFPSIKSPQIQVSPRDSSRKAKRKTAGLPPNTIQISQSVSKMEPFGSLPDSHVSESPYSYVTRDELKVIVKLSQTQCHSASNSPMSQKKFRQEDSSKTNTLTRSQSLTFILDQ